MSKTQNKQTARGYIFTPAYTLRVGDTVILPLDLATRQGVQPVGWTVVNATLLQNCAFSNAILQTQITFSNPDSEPESITATLMMDELISRHGSIDEQKLPRHWRFHYLHDEIEKADAAAVALLMQKAQDAINQLSFNDEARRMMETFYSMLQDKQRRRESSQQQIA